MTLFLILMINRGNQNYYVVFLPQTESTNPLVFIIIYSAFEDCLIGEISLFLFKANVGHWFPILSCL